MKKLFFISALVQLMILNSVYTLFAQAPEGFTYQAEARDSRGKLLTNTALTIDANILRDSASGTSAWDHQYNVTTDKYGLFTIVIGDPSIQNAFPNVDWVNNKYFLKIQVKYGTTTIVMPITQLLSVPYALYAKNAGSTNLNETDPIVRAINGMVKSNGTTISAAVPGTDYVAPNAPISSATKTKITYDEKGLVTNSANATTADIDASTDRNYVTYDQMEVIISTSGTNTGDQNLASVLTKGTNAGNQNITNLADPVNMQDAATKGYVDELLKALDFAGIITDIEGNPYKTIKIGTQFWMSENLRATKYNDGTAIPPVTDETEWLNLTTPGYCWYNSPYGALYNWYAVNTGKLCPAGWHVPSDVEWTTLSTYLGGTTVAGGKMKETGTTHWASPNTGATNKSGFSGLPGGFRDSDGNFQYISYYGFWWTSTETGCSNLNYNDTYLSRSGYDKKGGFSVRCVKN